MRARRTRPSYRRGPRAELPTETFAVAIRKDRRLGSTARRALGSAQVRFAAEVMANDATKRPSVLGFFRRARWSWRLPHRDAETTLRAPDRSVPGT